MRAFGCFVIVSVLCRIKGLEKNSAAGAAGMAIENVRRVTIAGIDKRGEREKESKRAES